MQFRRKSALTIVAALLAATATIVGLAPGSEAATTQYTLVDGTFEQNGLKWDNPPHREPADYTSPVNYAQGRMYYRIEILSKPSSLSTYAQFCFWRHTETKKFKYETCTKTGKAQYRFNDEGVYYVDAGRPVDFWKKNNTYDWSKGSSVFRFMLFDANAKKLLMEGACGGACYPGDDLYDHIPIRYKAEVILVAKGAKLNPPSDWDCPADWDCQGGGGGGGGTTTTTAPATTTTTAPPATTSTTVASTTSTTSGGGGGSGDVLLVTNDGRILAADQPYADAIRAAGYNPVGIADTQLSSAKVSAAKGVVISSSVLPKQIPKFLKTANTPMLVSEVFVMDDLGMATRPRQVSGQNKIDFGAGDAVTGISGVQAVTTHKTDINTARPGSSAVVVATRLGTSDAAIYAYESGAPMVSGNAPARRVGFFDAYPTPKRHSTVGDRALVDALRWVLG